MNEDTRKNIPSEPEIQSTELNEDQLDEVTGGAGLTMRLDSYTRRCTGNPSHRFVPRNPQDVCPICGAKASTSTRGN